MNPKWRDVLLGFALFALATLLILGARACRAATPPLTYAQKQAMVQAWRAGYHYGLPDIFAAIVFVESSLCQNAVRSSAGALGCAQVKPVTANEVTRMQLPEWQLSAPELKEVNMAIGARYLDLCMQRFGWPAGIGCYEQGIPRTAALLKMSCFRSNPPQAALHDRRCRDARTYIRKVLAAMQWIRELPRSDD